jgi:anaerobic nitric oxide reductase flavorubredoxin
MTYVKEAKVLFSMDGFGQHYASSKRFDDQVDEGALFEEATKYYANILLPFGNQYLSTLEKLKGVDVHMIATAHGIIWRKNIQKIIELYTGWAKHQTRKKAVIVYDTMWGSTELMAMALAEGIAMEGAEVQICRASVTERSLILKEVLESKAIIMGTPTLNMGMHPTMADFASYLKGLMPRNRFGVFFGSFGWSGGGVKALRDSLTNSGIEFPFEDIEIRFNPMDEGRKKCFELGRSIGKKIMSE